MGQNQAVFRHKYKATSNTSVDQTPDLQNILRLSYNKIYLKTILKQF